MGEVYKVNPEYAEERHRRKHALKRLFIFSTALLLVLVLILALVTFIIWLVLRPIHSPAWQVDDVKVITINVQTTASRRRHLLTSQAWGITTSLLNADVVVALRACNRNRHMEVLYERADVSVAYATAVVGRAQVPGFRQGRANATAVVAEVKAMSVPVSLVLANGLQGEIQSGSVRLQVLVDVRARVRIGGYKSFTFGVKTVCDVSNTTPSGNNPGQVMTKTCHSFRS